jgi:hypothetical protein
MVCLIFRPTKHTWAATCATNNTQHLLRLKFSGYTGVVTEAVEEKRKLTTAPSKRPWLEHMGKLNKRLIEEDSEKIDPEMWR